MEPIYSCDASPHKFTGKERDSESGLDNFGARYDSSSLGRFMSPDEFAGGPVDAISGATDPPGPLPYANIFNPQSLNKYAYVENNPLRYIDPAGHELEVAPELQGWVTEMRNQSPSFNAELAAHEGPNNPNLTINTGSTPNDPDGSPSIGNTNASIGGGPILTCSPNCVPTDRPYTYGGATVTVNDLPFFWQMWAFTGLELQRGRRAAEVLGPVFLTLSIRIRFRPVRFQPSHNAGSCSTSNRALYCRVPASRCS